jgi:uncharacterized membrane protein YciS (DUF1049 family)
MLFLKRLFVFIIAVVIIIFSITISGLNTGIVTVDIYFLRLEISLGFSLILTLFSGLIIGLLMSLFSFQMPLKSKNRTLVRKNRELMSQKQLDLSND